jgi:hypothetical protein
LVFNIGFSRQTRVHSPTVTPVTQFFRPFRAFAKDTRVRFHGEQHMSRREIGNAGSTHTTVGAALMPGYCIQAVRPSDLRPDVFGAVFRSHSSLMQQTFLRSFLTCAGDLARDGGTARCFALPAPQVSPCSVCYKITSSECLCRVLHHMTPIDCRGDSAWVSTATTISVHSSSERDPYKKEKLTQALCGQRSSPVRNDSAWQWDDTR